MGDLEKRGTSETVSARDSGKSMPIPPGATIEEQLEDHGMAAEELATEMDCDLDHVHQLLDGACPLTYEDAGKLEEVLGPPIQFWLNLQELYESKL